MGLRTLHAAGLRRDVYLGNLLITSMEPSQVIIYDFGKTVKAVLRQEESLGPIFTRVPEVDGVHHYNTKIDV